MTDPFFGCTLCLVLLCRVVSCRVLSCRVSPCLAVSRRISPCPRVHLLPVSHTTVLQYCFLSDVGETTAGPQPSLGRPQPYPKGVTRRVVSQSLPWRFLGRPLGSLPSLPLSWAPALFRGSVPLDLFFSGNNSEKSLLGKASACLLASWELLKAGSSWTCTTGQPSVAYVVRALCTAKNCCMRPAPPAIPAKRSPYKSLYRRHTGSRIDPQRKPSGLTRVQTLAHEPNSQDNVIALSFCVDPKDLTSACGWSDLQQTQRRVVRDPLQDQLQHGRQRQRKLPEGTQTPMRRRLQEGSHSTVRKRNPAVPSTR